MIAAKLDTTAADQACRHAYNAAFAELGLSWHWDAATYARLQGQGRDGVRAYLETEHSHLLRAYDADFLVDAIETTRARCYASMTGHQQRPAPRPSWADAYRLTA
jgi:hypothetical protein